MGSIIEYLLANAPTLGAMLIAFIVVWKISKYHSSLEDTKKAVYNLEINTKEHSKMFYETNNKLDLLVCKVDSFVDRMDNLTCNSHNQRLGILENDVSYIQNRYFRYFKESGINPEVIDV
jgi:hypothetical protein